MSPQMNAQHEFRMPGGTVVDSPRVADYMAKKDRYMAAVNDAKGQPAQQRRAQAIVAARAAMNAAWEAALKAGEAKSDTVGHCKIDWVRVQGQWVTA